ncbi:uncharacterized protein EI90DRAFT_3249301 [Cantharellus anzutake]|uniref:uncharacterized protein n=1 Tax=Cantharellus anzutake TaxID=1750568 RepID=UPI0019043525|nr:uncharacterized protein EI90DRAFT_3249301 [Cantharellus anzutake]KAF8322774.1 hypothetical protein EI90DRAFT_3249301 [Cantharellus anzutake]
MLGVQHLKIYMAGSISGDKSRTVLARITVAVENPPGGIPQKAAGTGAGEGYKGDVAPTRLVCELKPVTPTAELESWAWAPEKTGRGEAAREENEWEVPEDAVLAKAKTKTKMSVEMELMTLASCGGAQLEGGLRAPVVNRSFSGSPVLLDGTRGSKKDAASATRRECCASVTSQYLVEQERESLRGTLGGILVEIRTEELQVLIYRELRCQAKEGGVGGRKMNGEDKWVKGVSRLNGSKKVVMLRMEGD